MNYADEHVDLGLITCDSFKNWAETI